MKMAHFCLLAQFSVSAEGLSVVLMVTRGGMHNKDVALGSKGIPILVAALCY